MDSLESESLLKRKHTSINQILDTESVDYGAASSYTASTGRVPTDAHIKTKTYWYRWYILGLFSLVGALENITWNTWGPIEASARNVYGWSKGTVSLLADWGAITFVLFVFPSAWVLDVKGLRTSTVLCAFFIAIGSGLRCLSNEPSTSTVLIHIGQFLLGIGGPVAQSSGTVLSSTWFPPKQRTTATAVASLASYMGTAISFVIGPRFVTDIDVVPKINGTYPNNVRKQISGEIMNLLYVEFGIACFLLLLVLLFFPAKPPVPPSVTAALERVDYKHGLKQLIRNKQFQLIAFLYGITSGVYSAWCSDLALNLSEYNIDNNEASWFGFWAVIAGSVSGIILSLIADWFGGFMKAILLGLFTLGTAAFSIFTLMCLKLIPPSIPLFYLMSVLGGLCLNGAIPLFFELSVESSYPVAEGVNTGFMTFSNNIYCLIFLSLPMVPGMGTKWMNWALVGSCGICIPMMLFFKEKHKRLAVDVRSGSQSTNQINSPVQA
eukprot:gene18065-19874_t